MNLNFNKTDNTFLFFYFFLLFCFLFIFFNQSVLFLNEEFLVGSCVIVFLFIVFSFSKKMLNFSFFFKAESIYLTLIYLSQLIFLLSKKFDLLFKITVLNNLHFSRFQIYSLFLSISDVFASLSNRIFLNFNFTHFILTYFFCILFSNINVLANNSLNYFEFFPEEVVFDDSLRLLDEENDEFNDGHFFSKIVYSQLLLV